MKRAYPFAAMSLIGTTICSCGVPTLEGGRIYEDVPPEMPIAFRGQAKNAPIYQILVYSFADSNGDDIGDFQGIIDHLDYLQSLNVGYLWLSPIHPSNSYHHYDVKDYYAIDPLYGGEEGFKALVKAAEERGIGILLDMVFNHASRDSEWFLSACRSYVRHYRAGSLEEMRANPEDVGNDFVLSHDSSSFAGGAKTASITIDGITLYYEANFSPSMPEFDLSSPAVKRKQSEIMSHYFDLGVAGFRFDGCRYFFAESAEKSVAYMDELALAARAKKPSAALVGEYWDGYSQSAIREASSKMPIFHFPSSSGAGAKKGNAFFALVSRKQPTYAKGMFNNQKDALERSEGQCFPVYFLNNHDMDRYVPGSLEEAKVLAASYLLTPGTPTIYYGEEIALRGKRGSESTDAARRLPMQWVADEKKDDARCKNFDHVLTPKDQVRAGALEEIRKGDSLTAYYQRVLALRAAHPELRDGTYSTYGDEQEELCISRIEHEGKTKGFLVHNFDSAPHMTAMMPEGAKMDDSLSLGQDLYQGCRLRLSPYSTVYLEIES